MLIIFIFMVMLILMFMLALGLMLSMKKDLELLKSSPIECGMNPLSPPHSPFSLHFFLIAILFMIFDVELALLIPFPLVYFFNLKIFYFTVIFFLVIVLLGLLYEMYNGALNWIF